MERVSVIRRLATGLLSLMATMRRQPALKIVKIVAHAYLTGPLSLNEAELEDFAEAVVNEAEAVEFPSPVVSAAAQPRPPSSPHVCELMGYTGVWTAFVDGDPPQTWWFAVHQGYEWCSLDGRTVQKRLTPALRDDIDVVMPSAASASQQ